MRYDFQYSIPPPIVFFVFYLISFTVARFLSSKETRKQLIIKYNIYRGNYTGFGRKKQLISAMQNASQSLATWLLITIGPFRYSSSFSLPLFLFFIHIISI